MLSSSNLAADSRARLQFVHGWHRVVQQYRSVFREERLWTSSRVFLTRSKACSVRTQAPPCNPSSRLCNIPPHSPHAPPHGQPDGQWDLWDSILASDNEKAERKGKTGWQDASWPYRIHDRATILGQLFMFFAKLWALYFLEEKTLSPGAHYSR